MQHLFTGHALAKSPVTFREMRIQSSWRGLGSCVVHYGGAALGVMRQIVLAGDISRVWRSLMGSVLILFSIYLAIDFIRGSLLGSYGLV